MFIERARSAAPGAAAQLASAIAARYGIPAAEVTRRLAIGRFRVKGNVDRATADSFAADLDRLGAVVTVSSVDAPVPAVPDPVSLQAPRVQAPPPKPEPPRARPPSQSPYTSGLAAAMAQTDLEEPGLGALSGDFPLQLSTLDGADDASVSSGSRAAVPLPASFGPPSSAAADLSDDFDVSMDDDGDELGISDASLLPASIGPAAGVTALGDRPRSESRGALSGAPDMFAPPEAAAELQLALEVDDQRARKPSGPPPARTVASGPAPAPAPPATTTAAPAPEVAPRPARLEPAWKTHGRDPRVRYVAGLVLATVLAFIPATVIASIRERSAFAELNAKYEERESQVISRVQWDDLDRVRASFLERKRAERQSIAFTSLLIWVGLSAGLAYLWFRVIDWDRVLGPPPRQAP